MQQSTEVMVSEWVMLRKQVGPHSNNQCWLVILKNSVMHLDCHWIWIHYGFVLTSQHPALDTTTGCLYTYDTYMQLYLLLYFTQINVQPSRVLNENAGHVFYLGFK